VFEAAPPGKPVSPDLAGRYAADYTLGLDYLAADAGTARRLRHTCNAARAAPG
jgi:hypothetical protein